MSPVRAFLTGLLLAVPTASAPGTLAPTAAMRAARMAHTATVLPDQRVLIAGGFTAESDAAASAELYDATRRVFLALPRMRIVRHSHTATVLPDGRVLIAGGFGTGNAVLTAAEVFDPATNTFSATGAMRAARAGHVAVSLADGRVLIAGGVGPDWTFLASAEVYDPRTGRFTPTGAMTTARESHMAVPLRDGRVLVVGGHQGRRSAIELYASAELYDAATGTWRRTGDMRVRRHKHDAARLADGRVLVLGGSDERDDQGAYASTELWDPQTERFTDGPPMQRARYKHALGTVALPNGRLLVSGGAPQAEVYEPSTNRFVLVGGTSRMGGQFSASAPLPGGRVLVTGGYGNGEGPRAAAWEYRPNGG